MRERRRTWMIGAIGLITCGVLGMLRTSLSGGFGPLPVRNIMEIVTGLIYAAAVLMFAIGTTRHASVVSRRPLGVTSMAVVAVWPLLAIVVNALLPHDESSAGILMTFGYVALIVHTGAALVAASQIARAGVVSAPWRWAPLWVLGLQAFAWAVPQIAVVSGGLAAVQSWAPLYALLGGIAGLAGTLGLGILALVLAAQQRPESVEVYRSA